MRVQSAELRPLKAGEILDRAFRLYRANFWHFTRITAILVIPLTLLEVLSFFIFHASNITSLLQSFLQTYLLRGALMWAISHAYLGNGISLQASYQSAWRYFRSFFALNFLQSLAYVPLIIIAVVLFILFAGATPGGRSGYANDVIFSWLGIIIALIAIPYVLFFSTQWWLALPAIMFENLSGFNSLKRSWALTSNNFWHVALVVIASTLFSSFGILMMFIVIAFFLQIAWSLPQDIVISILEFYESGIFSALLLISIRLGEIITIPISMCILLITYYDMRVRYEGYDLELALQSTPEMLAITHDMNQSK